MQDSTQKRDTEVFMTHPPECHADETMAFAEVRLCRTLSGRSIEHQHSRAPEDWEQADWLVDVGGENMPEKQRLDHHQYAPEKRPRRENGVPYASAGMTWLCVGTECVERVLKEIAVEATSDLVQKIVSAIDSELMAVVDAMDNGDLYSKSFVKTPLHGEIEIETLTLFHLVRKLNLLYEEKGMPEVAFDRVTDLMQELLHASIIEKAHEEVLLELLGTGMLLEEGRVFFIDQPVGGGISDVLHELPEGVQFAVYQVIQKDLWTIRAIPKTKGSFDFRVGLPHEWCGLLEEAHGERTSFAEVSNIPGAVFCHPNGFCGGARSKDAALEIARRALVLESDL